MNSLGVVLSPWGLAVAERSEGERPEPQRTVATAKAGANSVARAWPDREVVAKPKRRTYTAEYKQRFLEEAEAAAATRDGFGALLRREGLYRGPKSKRNPLEEENQNLRRQNARLSEDLRKAHIIIQTALAQIHQNISFQIYVHCGRQSLGILAFWWHKWL